MEAQLKRETNELKRQEIEQKIASSRLKTEQAVRKEAADVESARSSIDNFLTTIDEIVATPKGVVENAAGPISDKIPTFRQSTADFEELVNTLDAQAFIAQIPNMTGKGALSDAEGRKLSASLKNFSLRQSPERLLRNAREAQRLMLKARQNLTRKYGVPDSVPDRPQLETTPEVPQGDLPVPSTEGFRVIGVR